MKNNNGYRYIDYIIDGDHCSCRICCRLTDTNCPNTDEIRSEETTCNYFKLNIYAACGGE